ncbi:MAG: patatin-like phospholipase family protein [Acidobacteriota bacterium]
MRRGSRCLFALPVLLLLPTGLVGEAAAEPDDARSPDGERPRLALVLSGGGARGAAHIGVLKVLEELHVAPDLIVGTSMGSIIGGLYAAGWSPDELEALLAVTDWDRLFSDKPLRSEKSFRRKQDDVIFLVPLKLRFHGLKPYIPAGAIGGQRLDLFLKGLELDSTGARDFDDLPIPFRAVATDITDGQAVVVGRGSLSRAMRASMAVPAMFPPVTIDGKELVDGGAAANLPVGIAQSLGAEAVIAVDITSPLAREDELQSLFAILGQQSSFLTVGNRLEDEKRLRPGDVLIRPVLGDLGFADFDKAYEAIPPGEAAAWAAADQLRRFAVTDEEWTRFLATHVRHPREDLIVDRVDIENTSQVDDRVVRSRVQITAGEPFHMEELSEDVLRLHALEYFGTIEPDFRPEDEERVLTIPTPRPRYGRNRLQFGVNVKDDFQGDTSYAVAVRHQFLAVNRRGGEWQNIGQIGTTSLLQTEFYQPLDFAMRWFVVPAFSLSSSNLGIWYEGEELARYRLKEREGRFAAGRVLGDWGEVRAGLFAVQARAILDVGIPFVPEATERNVGYEASFRVDTLDSTVFPTHGMRAFLGYERALERWGSDVDGAQAAGAFGYAFHVGKNVIFPAVEVSANLDGDTTLRSTFFLGGFLRLSGYAYEELFGRNGGLARVVYYRELFALGLGALRTPIYAGASIEAGNVYEDGDPITWDGLRHSGSIFVGADTALGPIYVGYGLADGGRHQVYLNIGARF